MPTPTSLTKIELWLDKKPLLNIYLPPILWAGIIFFFSAQTTLPSLSLSLSDFILKKSAHITVYAVLFTLVNRSLLLKNIPQNKAWKIAMAITLSYAITDEFHQTLIPGRFGTLRDTGYDMLGALLAFMWKYRYI